MSERSRSPRRGPYRSHVKDPRIVRRGLSTPTPAPAPGVYPSDSLFPGSDLYPQGA